MTDADEALLWARKDLAKSLKSKSVVNDVHQGLWDDCLDDAARGYRAGAAASAERIKELEVRVAELELRLWNMERSYPPLEPRGVLRGYGDETSLDDTEYEGNKR